MDDLRRDSAARCPTCPRRTRRIVVRRIVASALFALGGAGLREAVAAPRSRDARIHLTSAHQIAPDAEPVMCDASLASGITGLVTIGPMCPVVTQDDPCPDQPLAATLVIRDALGHELCMTRSGADGRFRAGLPPGWYELVPVSGSTGLPYAMSQAVIVEPGRYTEVIVSYDSGIR